MSKIWPLFLTVIIIIGLPQKVTCAPNEFLSLAKSLRCNELDSIKLCADAQSVPKALGIINDSRGLEREISGLVKQYERIFKTSLDYSPMIVLLSQEALQKGSIAPEWASALYVDKTLFIVFDSSRDNWRRQLIRALRHEIVHAFVASSSNNRCPAWFDEGLAMYLSGSSNIQTYETKKHTLAEINLKKNYRTLLDLEQDEAKRVYYAMDQHLRSLIFRKGFGAVRKFLGSLKSGTSIDIAYQNSFDETSPLPN